MVSDAEIKEKVQAHREAKQEQTQEQQEQVIVANEDLEQLKKLQNDMDNIVVVFGQLAIQEETLKKSKTTATAELQRLKDLESKLAQDLTKKYGVGQLDLETGKFTTTK